MTRERRGSLEYTGESFEFGAGFPSFYSKQVYTGAVQPQLPVLNHLKSGGEGPSQREILAKSTPSTRVVTPGSQSNT